MMYYTHLTFALLVSLLVVNFLIINNKILYILIVILFSIIPDIDETKSRIGRKNKLISKTINFIFGHRGIFHAIYIPLILFFIFNMINIEIAYAILIGYSSHLFLDALTKSGIKPFYPLFNKRINGFFKTNSIYEKIIFLGMVFANLYLVFLYLW